MEKFGRRIVDRKKFEEGIFSDLRNLKCGTDATLEPPKSDFLNFLYKNACLKTQKKQKVFFWFSVPHDKVFADALEKDLKKELAGQPSTTVAIREPALSFTFNDQLPLYDQISKHLDSQKTMYSSEQEDSLPPQVAVSQIDGTPLQVPQSLSQPVSQIAQVAQVTQPMTFQNPLFPVDTHNEQEVLIDQGDDYFISKQEMKNEEDDDFPLDYFPNINDYQYDYSVPFRGHEQLLPEERPYEAYDEELPYLYGLPQQTIAQPQAPIYDSYDESMLFYQQPDDIEAMFLPPQRVYPQMRMQPYLRGFPSAQATARTPKRTQFIKPGRVTKSRFSLKSTQPDLSGVNDEDIAGVLKEDK